MLPANSLENGNATRMTASIHSALLEATAKLAQNNIKESRGEATLLLGDVLNQDRAFILARPEMTLSAQQIETFRSFVARRGAGEPLQYITGHQGFYKLDFEVSPDVLIPRPETELIVEAALELFARDAPVRFADIGTGSGCIAISLLAELATAQAMAIDISDAALEIARRNAVRHQVIDRLELRQSDGFASIERALRFDLVVANPPYVSDREMRSLQREVQREPALALAGGPDGFEVIRRLLIDAPGHLNTGGYFIFEIGFGQGERVKELFDPATWELIEIRNDLAGIPRTVVLRKPG